MMMNYRETCLGSALSLLALTAACLLQSASAGPALQLAQVGAGSSSTERYLVANISGGLGQRYTPLKIHEGNNNERRLFIKASLDERSSPGPPPTRLSTPPQAATCTLGNDTYQVGDRWNPILPPFGVQLCVQCECIVRQRAFCYEAKVTCRRMYDDCPVVDSCANGRKPITVAGQCCKICPERRQQQLIGANSTQPGTKKASHDRVVKEYQTIMKTMPQCASKEKEKEKPKEKESLEQSTNRFQPTPTQPSANINTTSAHKSTTSTTTSINQTVYTVNMDQNSLVSDAEQRTLGQLMARKNRSEIIHFTLILID